jgi:hypothetical protein
VRFWLLTLPLLFLLAGCPTSYECGPCQVIGTNYGGGEVTIQMQVGDGQAIEMTAYGIDQALIDKHVDEPNPISLHPWNIERGQAYLAHFGDALHLDTRFRWFLGDVPTPCEGLQNGQTLWLELDLERVEPDGPWEGLVSGRLDRTAGNAILLDGAVVTVDELAHEYAGSVTFPTADLEVLASCLGGQDGVPETAQVHLEWAFDPAVSGDACDESGEYCY